MTAWGGAHERSHRAAWDADEVGPPLAVGYDWLTAQHEVAYVDILDILKGCTARVVWVSEHSGGSRVTVVPWSQADVGPAGVGPRTDV